jgi:hypothetical protein
MLALRAAANSVTKLICSTLSISTIRNATPARSKRSHISFQSAFAAEIDAMIGEGDADIPRIVSMALLLGDKFAAGHLVDATRQSPEMVKSVD